MALPCPQPQGRLRGPALPTALADQGGDVCSCRGRLLLLRTAGVKRGTPSARLLGPRVSSCAHGSPAAPLGSPGASEGAVFRSFSEEAARRFGPSRGRPERFRAVPVDVRQSQHEVTTTRGVSRLPKCGTLRHGTGRAAQRDVCNALGCDVM